MREFIDKLDFSKRIEDYVDTELNGDWYGVHFSADWIDSMIETQPTARYPSDKCLFFTFGMCESIVAFVKKHEREDIPDTVWGICQMMCDVMEDLR